MPKWVKFIIAVFLVPACAGAVGALWRVLRVSGHAEVVWVATLAGAGCWLAIYLLLPKPMWVYVFGHELTHVVWTWLLGGSVKKFKASSRGGHVVVTKSNLLIALAPYFFPLYAVLVAVAFLIGDAIWNWRHYMVWLHLLLGAAYGFHVTLTWHILKSEQSDIADQGYVFSSVIIFLGNMLVLLVGIPLLGLQVDVLTALRWWGEMTREVLRWFVPF